MQIRSHRFVGGVTLFALMLLLFVAPARAQGTAPDRGYVAGQFGFSFASGTSPVLGGEFGVTVSPTLMAYGGIGRFMDVMSGDIQEDLDLIGTGIEASIPATYLAGGVRYEGTSGRLRPYALAGIGVAFLSGKIEFNGTDITEMVEDVSGESLTSSQFLFEIGVGVHMPVGEAAFVDAGYRYTHIATEDGISVSRIFGGFGVRF